jgi:hypothetical protein
MAVKLLDILRHSMRQKPGTRLSQAGVDLGRKVGASLGPYDTVLTSNLERAVETAIAMGFAVSCTSEEIGAYPEALPHQIGWPAPLNEINNRLAESPELQEMAARQIAQWKSLLPVIPDGGAGLIVTHGALLEIGAIAVLDEIGAPIEGGAFAYCEGLRIYFEGAAIEKIEQMRLPESERMVSN